MTESDAQAENEFEHFHNDHARAIKAIVNAVKADVSGVTQARVADMFESFFGAEAGAFLDATDLTPKPEAVLKSAMSKMSDANRLQLVVGNLLEGVKRGEALGPLVERYEAIGLMDPPRRDPLANPSAAAVTKDGDFLEKALGWARKIGSILCRMGWNALRAIPRFVKLEPEVHLGFVGPVPTFSISFKVKTDGVSFHELGETLFQGIGAP